MSISRSKAAQLGKETVAILRGGHYTTPAGLRVEIAADLRRAAEGTLTYPPDADLPLTPSPSHATRFEVANETTLAAARRLATQSGHRVVALNFASARHAGGGFLGGARAQEESLCRSSGLYACIAGNAMYAFHAGQSGGFYTNYAIYSPDVPVIRGDDGALLDQPYPCSFITAPAVNVGAVKGPQRREIRAEMARRIDKVLTIAAGHGHDAVVLGAWGCGVFRNDPEMLATLFRSALTGPFSGAFAVVVFAVLDGSEDRHIIGPFERRFGT
jgi:uncharacterized protein (TIGR02452 family)